MRWVKSHGLILLILLIGAVLRFWDFAEIPYTHDELSALGRTQVSDWNGFIETGVKKDNHPAGVQLLLWGMAKLGGYGAAWIKWPFALAGVWSIWLLYLVGGRLFSEHVGLIAAALLATLQYPITFSQWARPYAIGLTVVLVLTWALLRYREASGKGVLYLLIFAFAAATSGYVHYFALLQAVIVSLAFIPLLKKEQWLRLAEFSLLAFLLWLPHLGLTLFHLDRGGIGEWLQAPPGWFGWHMLKYIFQFSILPVAILIGAALPDWKGWGERLRSYPRVMLMAAFTLPFLIGYLYSVLRNPLLHQSVLLFSLPFFLLWFASFASSQKSVVRISVLLLLAFNIWTLSVDREHYGINYSSEYSSSLNWLSEMEHPHLSMHALVDLREDLVQFMQLEGITQAEMPIQMLEPLKDQNAVASWLDENDGDFLFLAMNAGTDPEVFAAALNQYPCISDVQYYNVGEAYLLSKKCDSREEIASRVFEGAASKLGSDNPYTESIELKWSQIPDSVNLHFKLDWQGEPDDAILVVEMSDEKPPYWRGVMLEDHINSDSVLQKAYHTLYRSEMDHEPDALIKAYVWANNASDLTAGGMKAYAVRANPNKYKLFRE